jgi:aminopeptidase N
MLLRRVLPLLAMLPLLGCPAASTPPPPTPAAPTSGQPPAPREEVPLGRLPSDTRPTHYRLDLEIVPSRDRFSGVIEIDVQLDRPRQVIWLHGNGHEVSEARVTAEGVSPLEASYEQVAPGGVVRLTVEKPIPAGKATIRLAFTRPFGKRLNGLYKVVTQGDAYAFTQMEPVWTRKAFPCFNEPAFKVPWTMTVTAPVGQAAIANTAETKKEPAGEGLVKHHYATTEPLPSYLIAFAVGPLDVVEAPPIPPNEARKHPLPFRGVAAKGRGKELAFALKHTPGILAELEKYFGLPYPYDKLDVIAVPDKGGAMENAGAVTFREWLLLLDPERAPTSQRRAFAYVMAHELAHMWFGDLVTMPWWDDIWLNEAFATWMGHRAVQSWDAKYEAAVRQLEGVHRAMSADSLLSARQIRQPVNDESGIHNAFDSITYRKGGGVLGMFERWMGPAVFQKGLRAYMKRHRHGTATADDLMKAFGDAAGKDVATPFRTFLMQAGLPNVDVALRCEAGKASVELSQTRYLPLGSKGDAKGQTWQIPVCLRYEGGKETCTLLSERQKIVPLDGPSCPKWLIPNAGAAGYYQWSGNAELLRGVSRHGRAHLEVREKLSFIKAIRGMLGRGVLEPAVALEVLQPFATDPHPSVAAAPLSVLGPARRWLHGTPLGTKAQARIAKLYRGRLAQLGWKTRPNDTAETKLLRRNLIQWVAMAGRDPAARKRATLLAKRYLGLGGDDELHQDAIDPDLVGTVLFTAGRDADSLLFKALHRHFDNAPDAVVRGHTLSALSAATTKPLPDVVLDLSLSDALKVSERITPLSIQMQDPATRDNAWAWLEAHVDELMAELPNRRAGWLPSVATSFCDAAYVERVDALFGPRLPKMAGGAREIAKAKEALVTCSARKARLLPGLEKLLASP